MPKILQINSCANWGSTGKIAEQINQVAATQGWDIYFAYGRDVNPCQSKLIHVGNSFSQALAVIEARLFDNDGLSSRFATRQLVKKIKQIKPDIIHLHNLHGYYINYKILFNYLNTTDIPIVWTLHDCWSFTGHCGHFVSVNCEKWKKECKHCPLKKRYPASWIFDGSSRNYCLKQGLFSANNNLHIVTVSEWLANIVRQSFLKDADIRVINNGVDLKLFKPLKTEKKTGFRILGVSSVWPESKGLSSFVELNKKLKDDEELVLVGVDEKTKERLPQITCVPRTDSIEQLITYYNQADVVLSLSKAETFGLTIAEGFACGVPGIVFNNTALPELIIPETGFIVENDDIEALYQRIQIIKKAGKNSYTSACRTRAEQYYNNKKRIMEYVAMYEELIAI